MVETALKIGDTSQVTFTFSETPTGFTQDDISVDNGSLSNILVSNTDDKVYTATFTPSADIEVSSNLISVGTDYTDTAGNTGVGETSDFYSVDTKAPTVTINMGNSALKIGDTSSVTFVFSETPTGFTQDDISIENGSLSNIVVHRGRVYTATFTPDADIEDSSNLISVGTGYTDAAGNTGVGGTSVSYSVDTKAPTVTINMAQTALKIGESSIVTFTFSETPTAFTLADVSADNGSLSDLLVNSSDDKIYTAIFTPSDAIEDSSNLITVGTDYTDMQGNTGTAGASPNYSLDTIAPTVTITMSSNAMTINGSAVLTFTFSEAPVNFTKADISVQNGYLSGNAMIRESDSVFKVMFFANPNVQSPTNVISVSSDYTDAAGNSGTVANSANYSVDTRIPTLAASFPQDDASSFAVADDVVLIFNESIQLGGSGNIVLKNNAGADIIIDVANHSGQLSTNGATLTINPNVNLTADSQYSIQIDSSAIVDSAGNNYQGIADESTLNFSTAAAVDTSIVVFDLSDGQSSSHSGRVFQENVDYNIYIKIDSVFNPANRISIVDALGNNNQWTGGENLGKEDKIILVGTGTALMAHNGVTLNFTKTYDSGGSSVFGWQAGGIGNSTIMNLSNSSGKAYTNRSDTAAKMTNIWIGNWVPNLKFGTAHTLPANVATSQGV